MTHPMLEVRDLEYQGRIAAAMLEAVFEASQYPTKMTAAVRSGEIAVAALAQIAYFAADTDVSSSPTKKRQFCDAVAKRLFDLISEMKQDLAEGSSRVIVFREPPHAGRSN
jgi:electron transfer flavoprotein alpha subunit